MSITPYSTPAEAPIMDTYVPIPFEAMYQAGAMTQGRYDENMELEETIGSDISKYGGAQRVNIPGLQNQYIKMPDYDVVEGVKEGYNTELNDITSSISDKSSPELRAKLKGLGSRIRNDIGPNGKIGIATSNMKEIENFNKMLRDNPKLANSPQLVPYIQRLRAHEEATKDGSIQRLDLSGAPGEDVDITKKLTDLLKNYGEQSGIPGLGSVNGFPGLIRELQASGIKEEDIQNTVTNFLRTDPEAANQLQLQAQFDNYRGGETTAEGLIGNYANIMGDVFSKSKVTSKLRDNNVFMANYKNALKQEDVDTPYVRPTIMNKQGSGIESVADIKSVTTTAKETYDGAQGQLDTYLNKVGIVKNADGSYPYSVKDENGITHDYTDDIQLHEHAVNQALNKINSLKQLDSDANHYAGIPDDYYETADFKKKFSEMKETVTKIMDNGSSVDSEVGLSLFNYIHDSDETVGLTIEERAIKAVEFNDSRFKDKEKYLEEQSKDGTFTAGVTQISNKEMRDKLVLDFKNNFKNGETAVGSIINTKDLTELQTSKESFLEGEPEFAGFFLDDDAEGAPKLMFNLNDEDGEFDKQVKIDPPSGFVEDLIKHGMVDASDLFINAQLVSETGALGDLKSNDILTLGPDGYSSKAQVFDKKAYGEDITDFLYRTIITSSDGIPVSSNFRSKGELIKFLSNISKENYNSKINKK